MDYKDNVVKVNEKVQDFLQYIESIGNECAYTDSIIEEIIETSDSLKRAYQQENKFVYLINVTFHAGSDSEEDTDNDTVLLYTNKKYSEDEFVRVFDIVNAILNFDYDDDNETAEEFPISYEDGLNLDTLFDGVEIFTSSEVKYLKDHTGSLPIIEGYYNITQWQ